MKKRNENDLNNQEKHSEELSAEDQIAVGTGTWGIMTTWAWVLLISTRCSSCL